MSFDAHANLAYTLVSIAPAPAASGTSLSVIDGSVFPVAPFNATVWAIGEFPLLTNAEIVRVTNVVGNVLTITRQAEGSPNRSILVGDQIAATITAKTLEDVETAIPSTAGLLSAINVSAGLTSNNLSALTFDNSNGVSFGLTGSVLTATVATNYQSQGNYLTTAALSQDSSKYAGTNGAITGGSITVNTAGVSVNLPGYLTTAMASNRASDFVQATANFFGTNASGTIASNAISISVSAPAGTQSNQSAIKALGVSNTGQTAGNTGVSTGIDWVLAGSQSITLSESTAVGGPNTIWFQHPAWLTTAMVSGDSTKFVQANAVFNGTNATGTIASGAISVSVAAPIPIATSVNPVASASSVGTVTRYAPEDHRHAGIGGVGISTSGGTAGTTGSVIGTYWFQGGNNVTVSQITSNNGSHTLIISGANAGGAQTGISGIIVSDATYTSGTVSFSNQGNVTIGSSVNGATQFIRLSVAAQTNQSAIKAFGVSNTGNTAGNTGVSTGIDWVLAASNSLTLSQSTAVGGPDTVWLQVGAYLTTAMASGASTQFVQANAGFNGTNASGTIASNAISVSVAAPIPIATAVNDVASANSTGTVTRYAPEDHRHAGVGGIGISTSGNTAGTTKSVQGTYWFQGGNSITVSQITSNNGSHTLVISAGNYITTAALSGDTSKYVQAWELTGNTAGTTSSLQGTKLYFEGGNSITVSGNSNTIKLSVGAYLTTAMLSGASTQFVQANAGFNGTNASGTIASNSISVSVAAPIPIATAVKAVASVGSTGTVTRYAPEDHQHVGVAAFAVTNTGNTLGNTRSQVGTLYLAASGAITASQSTAAAGNDTVWFSVASQTNQTLGLYMSSNTTSSVSSGTVDARSLTFRGVGVASVGYSNGEVIVSVPAGGGGITAINVSAGTTSNNLSEITFADSNGISFGIGASTITASANTVGTATTGYSVASANSVGTVTRWAAEDHRHAGVGGIGISTSGNSAGTTGSELGTYWLQGGNNITISQITSNNGSHTAVFSGPNLATVSMWPYPLPGSAAISTYYSGSTSQGAGGASTRTGYTFSLYVVPMVLPVAVGFSEIRIGVSMNSVAGTGSVTHLWSGGIYSNNASTLSLMSAHYAGLLLSQNSVTSQTFSVVTFSTGGLTPGGAGGFAGLAVSSIFSRAVNNMSSDSQVFGRMHFIRLGQGASSSLSAGQYYYALGYKSVSGGANVLSNVGHFQSDAVSSQAIPDLGRESVAQTSNWLPWWGAVQTTFTSVSDTASWFAMPNAIAAADITLSQSSAQRFHMPYLRNNS